MDAIGKTAHEIEHALDAPVLQFPVFAEFRLDDLDDRRAHHRAVRVAGLLFVALGLVAFAFPAAGNELLATGFGGVHVVFGLWIQTRPDPR